MGTAKNYLGSDTTSADYYPSDDIVIGNASNKTVGSYPIYGSMDARIPFGAIDKKVKEAKIANYLSEQEDKATQKGLSDLYENPKHIDPRLDPEFQKQYVNNFQSIFSDAMKYYRGDQKAALADLSNPSGGVFGTQLRNLKTNTETYANTANALTKIGEDIQKAKENGEVVLPAYEKSFHDAMNLSVIENNPEEVAKVINEVGIYKKAQDVFGKYLTQVKPKVTETAGGVTTKEISFEDARKFAGAYINEGNRRFYAEALGKPDLTVEEIKTQWAKDAGYAEPKSVSRVGTGTGTQKERGNIPTEGAPLDIQTGTKEKPLTVHYDKAWSVKATIPATNSDAFDLDTRVKIKDAPAQFDLNTSNIAINRNKRSDGTLSPPELVVVGKMTEFSEPDKKQIKEKLWRDAINKQYGSTGNVIPTTNEKYAKPLEPSDEEVDKAVTNAGKNVKERTVQVPFSSVEGSLRQQGVDIDYYKNALKNHKPIDAAAPKTATYKIGDTTLSEDDILKTINPQTGKNFTKKEIEEGLKKGWLTK